MELTWEVYLKSTDDLTIYFLAEEGCTYTIHSRSKFTMYTI